MISALQSKRRFLQSGSTWRYWNEEGRQNGRVACCKKEKKAENKDARKVLSKTCSAGGGDLSNRRMVTSSGYLGTLALVKTFQACNGLLLDGKGGLLAPRALEKDQELIDVCPALKLSAIIT